MILSDKQKDALTEQVNISFSRAAKALSDLTGQHISLDVPLVKLFPINELEQTLNAIVESEELTSIHQLFKGKISGDAMLLVTPENALLFNDLLVGNPPGTSKEFDDATREVLIEMGNIILNSCLGMFGNLLQVHFTFSIPQLRINSLSDMMETLETGDDSIRYVLFIYMGFHIRKSNIDGYLVVVLGVNSMEYLLQRIDELMNHT